MKLLEAMKGKHLPCGEGECVSNWGWILGQVIKNRVKELELTGEELLNLLVYLVSSAQILLLNIENYEDFNVLGVQIKRIQDELEEEGARQAMSEFVATYN